RGGVCRGVEEERRGRAAGARGGGGGVRFDIYEALRAKANEGVALIVKSSDPLELAGLCDRVVVMSRGVIVDEIPGHELGEQRIVEAIVGGRAAKKVEA